MTRIARDVRDTDLPQVAASVDPTPIRVAVGAEAGEYEQILHSSMLLFNARGYRDNPGWMTSLPRSTYPQRASIDSSRGKLRSSRRCIGVPPTGCQVISLLSSPRRTVPKISVGRRRGRPMSNGPSPIRSSPTSTTQVHLHGTDRRSARAAQHPVRDRRWVGAPGGRRDGGDVTGRSTVRGTRRLRPRGRPGPVRALFPLRVGTGGGPPPGSDNPAG